ncbi:30S ribosomal protein S13 [Methanothermobacter thermautotrophicus]|jgi:small subunit ribosomal protein S13|uniref:Small ribosomal subunit protein uS13 n=2 Tax=Methanothermobacter TaxID=145260 RepID=A0A842YL09_METTF|nr:MULTISPECIES: 30S ribosomal protein S13 [Methanothermobacter]ADL58118.1 30S ribosomal protein S13p [Methanothermobacter marburgensis str. Marburg]MBE2899280.1 30S ribosomal protein S13 [Methanothermobacter thermautotrophicus]MCG2828978.1 30S ribosomal protein S13 [Methanothermobacter sp. K4]MCQ8905836.1 30S ribosomal protein S13 [Methanothermobacter sp.]MDI9615610.1 30S ribosomal protein S13 [Methanothermobacter sp.]
MEEEFKHMVRIARKDIDGNKTMENALTSIKGVGKALSRAIIMSAGYDLNQRIGYLSDEEIERLEEAIKNPAKYNIPSWMINRRNDYETGEDKHLIESDLDMCLREDLNRMRKTRSYKGRRHELGLPVRGQRTKSTFRKGSSVGVRRKKR